MTKGAKIGIGIGVVVALGVASYFLFFRKKGEKGEKGEKNKKGDAVQTVLKTPLGYMNGVTDKPTQAWVNFPADKRPAKGTIQKGDIATISDIEKLNGEYEVLGVWVDANGKDGAIAIDLNNKYKLIATEGGKDTTFAGYGEMRITRPMSSFCGCGA